MDRKIIKKKHSNGFAVFWKRFRRQKAAMFCLGLLCFIIIICIFAPLIAPYGFAEMDTANISKTPSMAHLLGTDDLGRDILTRLLYGGRYSVSIGLIATLVAVIGGIVLGSIAGYFGGVVDNLIMRFFDVMQALPSILLSITVSTVLGPGFFNLIIALAIGAIPGYARILRAQILSIRGIEYIEAAVSTNCSVARIIARHIVSNSMAPLLVQATMGVAQQILGAATLAYVGLGIQPPTPEWGAMLNSARSYIRVAPYMLLFPGIMIMITVLCINMIGDGARDALDPKLKS